MARSVGSLAMRNAVNTSPRQIPYPPLFPATTTTTSKATVAFTTPPNYAAKLSHLLAVKNFHPLWSPTITTEPIPHALIPHLSPPNLEFFSAIAFTSRTGIKSLLDAAIDIGEPLLSPHGPIFIISALGKDSELLDYEFISKICSNLNRIQVLVPPIASPSGLVESLGVGNGRRVLCPVPRVVGLKEPTVVPNFLSDLGLSSWCATRVDSYETRWLGPECAKGVVERSKDGELDAIVFTSTAEVEGLLKSLREFGLDWEMLKRRCPGLVVAAHGPVTAAGAERFGIQVDLVSSKFDSFDGVVDALHLRLQGFQSNSG